MQFLNLDIDLKLGVVPISKAASALAALIKRARVHHTPIIVTQKGYPTGVLLDIDTFTALRELAERAMANPPDQTKKPVDEHEPEPELALETYTGD